MTLTNKWNRPTVAIDFDGVLHSYTTPWSKPWIIPDPPVRGAMDFLAALLADGSPGRPVIVSSRAASWRGRRSIRRWLKLHSGSLWYEDSFYDGMSSIKVTNKKVPAAAYLDDRAVRFEGTFPESSSELRRFVEQVPWNKGPNAVFK